MKKELTINELDKIIEDINKLWEQPKEEKLLTKEQAIKNMKN